MADIFVVRKNLNDVKTQKGAFSNYQNARSLAMRSYGYRVFNVETGACLYTPPAYHSKVDAFLACMKYMNRTVKEDNLAGKQWTYCNTKGKEKDFDTARAKNNRKLNCVDGVQWAMLMCGAFGSTRRAIQWYMSNGKIVWCSKTAEEDLKKYCKIIHINGKYTVGEAIKANVLKPGDIIGYMTLSHTNAYYGNNKSFDSGHANCIGSGEGAKFKRFICATTYSSYKISYIIRLIEPQKETSSEPVAAPSGYRCRVGIFSVAANAERLINKIAVQTGFGCFKETKDGQIYVYCGSFSQKANAQERVSALKKKGFAVEIDTI